MAERLVGLPPRSVVLDADSTLAGIEGIDWLAALRPAPVAARIAAFTNDAMAGRIALEAVYGERLAIVAPTAGELAALGEAYIAAVAPGAARFVVTARARGVRTLIVSGGLRPALLPLAAHLGIAAEDVYAVEVRLGPDGGYRDFDRASPLAAQRGKGSLVAGLGLARAVVAVGDGSTDLEIRTTGAADLFVAFTGFVRREPVAAKADWTVDTFDALTDLLLPTR